MSRVPVPPLALRERVGRVPAELNNEDGWREFGELGRRGLEGLLPTGWTWKGKSVLDFGCGASKILQTFLEEAREAEFWGTDIDQPSIDWNVEQLSPPLHFVRNDEAPPLPFPNDKFDLVYVFSVFTHITDLWADWLLELHRVLAPGGLLIASFMGGAMSDRVSGEPWSEQRVGMNVFEAGQSWEQGGPMVLMSPWWIREHWGRLFEIDDIVSEDPSDDDPAPEIDSHGMILGHKDQRPAPSAAELQRIDLSDPRECAALAYNVRTLIAESARNRSWLYGLEAAYAAQQRTHADTAATRVADAPGTAINASNPGIRGSTRLLVHALRDRVRRQLR